jgi:hypothetical protein
MHQDKAQRCDERFLEFIRLFASIGKDSRLFPKKCLTCGKEYENFPEYIHQTSPIKHCLEDYRDGSDALGTMQYRNCRCGSTLVINFTRDVYPLIDDFWEMIGREAKERDKSVREVVLEFREQCNRYIMGLKVT